MISQHPSKRQCIACTEPAKQDPAGLPVDTDAELESALKRIADECLAGRLLSRAQLCKQVKNALELLGWRKESVKVRPVQLADGEEEPRGQKMLALALTPAGVRGVQDLLTHNEKMAHEAPQQPDLRQASTPQQQPPPPPPPPPQSAERRRIAAQRLLSTMLCEGSVQFCLGLPRAAELGDAFPRSASAPDDGALFTLPLPDSTKHNVASTGGDPDHSRFLFAELFAGIGGFRLGLESIGGRCVLMAEQDRFCHLTAKKNFSDEGVDLRSTRAVLVDVIPDMTSRVHALGVMWPYQDVTELSVFDVPPHHILTAGFPCQSFSQLGARHGGRDSGSDGRLGLNDETRGNLIWHVLRIANATRPAALILENVRGLLTLDGGDTLATILRGIRATGYCVDYALLNSATVLAQHRERLYFVCIRADLVNRRHQRRNTGSPEPKTLVETSSDRSAQPSERLAKSPQSQQACCDEPATGQNEVTAALQFPWPDLPDLKRTIGDILEPEEMVSDSLSLDEHRWAKISGSSYYAKHPTARVAELGAKAQTIGSSYKRGWALYSQFVPVLPSGTTAAGGSIPGGVGGGGTVGRLLPRFFTPREVARLQGFPETFVLDGLDPGRLYHQLGNAVSPPIVAAVGGSLIAWLEGKTDAECKLAGVTAALRFVDEEL